MIDEKIIAQLEKNIIHKKYIMDTCLKLSKYLSSVNRDEDAIELMKRAVAHDNSKFEKDELFALASIQGEDCALINPKVQMSEKVENIVKIHWKRNRHHPEHFSSYLNMSEIDIMEMVCDWYARSLEFGTDFLEFVKIRNENRFHFEYQMYEKIMEYCNILISIE